MTTLAPLTWPVDHLEEPLLALARQAGLSPGTRRLPSCDAKCTFDRNALQDWLMHAAGVLGLEAEPVDVPYPDADTLVKAAGPAILLIPDGDAVRALVIMGRGGRMVPVLGPEGRTVRVSSESLRAALCQRLEAPLSGEIDSLLALAAVAPGRRSRVATALFRSRLHASRLAEGWLIRLPASAPIGTQLRQIHGMRRLFGFAILHGGFVTLGLIAWWLLGGVALAGMLDWGWLLAWALVVIAQVPVRAAALHAQGFLAIDVGILLKQRMLAGALSLSPESVRHLGVGQLLGIVHESEAVESLALNGGLLTVMTALELPFAAAVLSQGTGGWLHVGLLLGWTVVLLAATWRYARSYTRWTTSRTDMTHDVIERMVGHRTRLAQEPQATWHDEEDAQLAAYLRESAVMDRLAAWVTMLGHRGWPVIAILGITPALLTGQVDSTGLAIAVGGTLLAARSLTRLASGMTQLVGAGAAWRQVQPLVAAATVESLPETQFQPSPGPGPDMLIDGRDLWFHHQGRRPVLRGMHLSIRRGERVLLQGPSGGGKSTLASLLTGLRAPESGVLLLDGLDHQTLGTTLWRRQVVSAPQFHENHVFTGTFAFNVLLGRGWPATQQDLILADTVCRELRLGDLLDRMPAGMMQMVGETGWQLSHGEKSRLFIARALVQDADLVVLDESFAALDPETLQTCLRTVLERARTLVVIAHP